MYSAPRAIHGDDTTVPVLAKLRTVTGRYGPMCAMTGRSWAIPASRDILLFARSRRHASGRHLVGYAGVLQADAYAGYGDLYNPTEDRDQ